MADSLGLADTPDWRKQHSGTVPLTGGIAIFFPLLFGALALNIAPYTENMLIIATLVFLVGVYDDSSHINATLRLFIQFGSGLALATYGGIAIVDAGNLLALGDIPLLMLSVPLTALSLAGSRSGW